MLIVYCSFCCIPPGGTVGLLIGSLAEVEDDEEEEEDCERA